MPTRMTNAASLPTTLGELVRDCPFALPFLAQMVAGAEGGGIVRQRMGMDAETLQGLGSNCNPNGCPSTEMRSWPMFAEASRAGHIPSVGNGLLQDLGHGQSIPHTQSTRHSTDYRKAQKEGKHSHKNNTGGGSGSGGCGDDDQNVAREGIPFELFRSTYPGRHVARERYPQRQVARDTPDLSLGNIANVVVCIDALSPVFFSPKDRAEESDAERAKFFVPEADHLTLLATYKQWKDNKYSGDWCNTHYLQVKALQKDREQGWGVGLTGLISTRGIRARGLIPGSDQEREGWLQPYAIRSSRSKQECSSKDCFKTEASKKQESQQEERESKQEITASSKNDKQESTSKLWQLGGSYLVRIKKERAGCNPMQSGRVEASKNAAARTEASKKQESQQEERESKQEITASSTNDKQESTSKLSQVSKKQVEKSDEQQGQGRRAESKRRKNDRDDRGRNTEVSEVINSLLDLSPEKWGLPPFEDLIDGTLPLEHWHIGGRVIKGYDRGSKVLAIPTANLSVERYAFVLAEHLAGVYFGWAKLSSRGFYKMAMSNFFTPRYANTCGGSSRITPLGFVTVDVLDVLLATNGGTIELLHMPVIPEVLRPLYKSTTVLAQKRWREGYEEYVGSYEDDDRDDIDDDDDGDDGQEQGERFRGCPIRDKSKKCGVYGFLDLELPSDYYKGLVYSLHKENKALKRMNRMPVGVMDGTSGVVSNNSFAVSLTSLLINMDKGKGKVPVPPFGSPERPRPDVTPRIAESFKSRPCHPELIRMYGYQSTDEYYADYDY
ncbi:bifunctional riboflavin kinase/FMN phosphatase-like protein [Tanacetum coccineum]